MVRKKSSPKGRLYERVSGKPQAKFPERPPLSAIVPIEYVPLPTKIAEAIRPSGPTNERRHLTNYQYAVEKAAAERAHAEAILGKPIPELDKRTQVKLRRLRKNAKVARRGPAFAHRINPGVHLLLQPLTGNPNNQSECRFRQVTIKECLTQVCSNQKEFMPVWGNWSAYVCTAPCCGWDVQSGEFPAFSIRDCVPDEDGFWSSSDGWVWVGASIHMSPSTNVLTLGVNFEGSCWVDVDGEDHVCENEWAECLVTSNFNVRSVSPGGGFTYLTPPSGDEHEEIYEYNEWGPTNGYSFVPSNRSVAVNLQVDECHQFHVEYTLKWEVSRSPTYDASACFGMNGLKIKPFIIYEVCHEEWREVAQFYKELAKLGPPEATRVRIYGDEYYIPTG